MSNGNDSILEMYLYETNTLLEQLDGIVLASEQADTFSQDDVNEIFRIMHTIKGSSAMMEFSPLMTVAHRIEDMFFIIRENTMSVVQEAQRPELFDMMFHAVDYFRSEIAKLESDTPLSQDIDSFLTKVNSLMAKIKGDTPSEAPVEEAAADPAPALEPEFPISPPLEANSNFPHALQVHFDEGAGMENLRAYMLVTTVRDLCAESDFIFEPADVEGNPDSAEAIIDRGFVLRFKDAGDRDRAIPAVAGSGSIRSYQASDDPAPAPVSAAPVAVADSPATAEKPGTAAKTAAKATAKPAADSATGQQHAKESLISVNLSKLDQLMAVVGEIVITESMVTSSPDLRGLKLDTFTKSARQLRKLTDELQDVSMSLRMVPVSGTFQKMNRIVRDIGKKLGKQVRLTLVGEETEVDKTIVDSISDPIMHIVRNSMDHGIETSAAERIAAGKDPVGEIMLSARHTGSEVIIEIRDDGQGVNTDKVLAKAINNGLASPDVEYSQRDILNFLMMPGFSTNLEVTEFSGRGVGMDVVKKNVEDVGGVVHITSEWGKGMATTLKIPLTMAIMDGMEVSVGDSIFTIPINNIRQSFKVTADQLIRDSAQGEMIRCMDSFYPIIRIKEAYRLDKGMDDIEDGILLWLDSGEHSYCLFVDELMGEQQVVVKPLPGYVNALNIKNSGINGCTILGDGNISIILDVANLYSAVQTPGF